MKQLILPVLFLSMFLLVSLAQAQTPNMMGLYFDEGGTTDCAESLPNFSEFFVVLHNPSVDFIEGVGFHAHWEGPMMILAVSWRPAYVIDVCDPAGHACAGFGDPFPLSSSTVLVSYMMHFFEEFEDICFALEGSVSSPDPELPYLILGTNPFEYLNCSVAPGPGNGCVATIGNCVVSSEHHEFGSIKAMYR